MDKLFIIGNGFDKAHGLKSDYLYFKKYPLC
ncbi:AbiH family protein [Streptococcus suis]|nr:AbiH family protein [Streptococcus suis]